MPDLAKIEAEELLSRMPPKEYYVIDYRLLLGLERLKEKLHEHLHYMVTLEKSGVLFLSGPLFDQAGEMTGEGITVVRAASFEDAENIALQEPFVLAGLREAKIRRWIVNEGCVAIHTEISNGQAVMK